MRRPAPWSRATATGSPNDAARATSWAVTVPCWSSATRSRADRPSSGGGRAGPAEGGAAGQRLEAAEVAAAADDERVVDDLDVADVAGTPLRAAMEVAVRDDARADPGPDLHDHDVVVAGRDPGPPLAEREQVDVVVDPDRGVVAVGEPLPDRVAVPAGHDRRRDRPAGSEFDRTRARRCRPPTAVPGSPGPSRGATRRARRPGRGSASGPASISAGSSWWPRIRPSRLGDGDVDARGAEVRDEDVPGIGAERQLARRPTARARPDLAFGDQAAIERARRRAARRWPARDPSARRAPTAIASDRAGSRRGP